MVEEIDATKDGVDPLNCFESWIEARQHRGIPDDKFIEGLDKIEKHAGRTPVNDETLCKRLLSLDSQAASDWARDHQLCLGHSTYFMWLDGCLQRIDTVDLGKESTWIVHPRKHDDHAGVIVAMAILSGQGADALHNLFDPDRLDGAKVAKGICSALYRHAGGGYTSTLSPSLEGLAWTAKHCKPVAFKRGANEIMMDDEFFDAVIKPLIEKIKRAPSELEATQLDQATPKTNRRASAIRL